MLYILYANKLEDILKVYYCVSNYKLSKMEKRYQESTLLIMEVPRNTIHKVPNRSGSLEGELF